MNNPPSSPVLLNVYDLIHPENEEAVPTLNSYLYGVGIGLYHSGVSVHGTEYCYGGHAQHHTGVFQVEPRNAPDARYRETILIGKTFLTPHHVTSLIQAMADIWSGNTYNLLTRNCNHFASDLCERLTGNPAPVWVNRLAWVGEKAKFLLPKGFDTPTAAPVTAAAAAARSPDSQDLDDLLNGPNPSISDDDFLPDPDHDQ